MKYQLFIHLQFYHNRVHTRETMEIIIPGEDLSIVQARNLRNKEFRSSTTTSWFHESNIGNDLSPTMGSRKEDVSFILYMLVLLAASYM